MTPFDVSNVYSPDKKTYLPHVETNVPLNWLYVLLTVKSRLYSLCVDSGKQAPSQTAPPHQNSFGKIEITCFMRLFCFEYGRAARRIPVFGIPTRIIAV